MGSLDFFVEDARTFPWQRAVKHAQILYDQDK